MAELRSVTLYDVTVTWYSDRMDLLVTLYSMRCSLLLCSLYKFDDKSIKSCPRSTPATILKQQATMSKRSPTLSKPHSTLLPKRQHCRTSFSWKSFDKVETNWTCLICFDFVERAKLHSTLLPKAAILLPNTATIKCRSNFRLCRSNIRHRRKNRSTCSIRQCCLTCFDIVAGVDGA